MPTTNIEFILSKHDGRANFFGFFMAFFQLCQRVPEQDKKTSFGCRRTVQPAALTSLHYGITEEIKIKGQPQKFFWKNDTKSKNVTV